MLNINKQINLLALVAVFAVIPTVSFAGSTGGSDYYGSPSSDWSYGSGSYSSPSYYDSGYDSGSDWSYGSGSYSSPSYYDSGYSSGYSSPSYGGGYTGSSYSGSTLGGYGYTPSYGGSYGGSTYKGLSYGGSSIPSSAYSYSSSNPTTNSSASNNTNTSATGGNAVATGGSASSSNTNVNNNVNNVYVYTNPSGNAVVHNPEYQRLDGYCMITPTNPRVGQTVTATAYMTGGIGDYTYTWGGDLSTTATGVSTSFTSYSAGTKNITVTVRSGQDVITKNCTVTFDGNTVAYNSYNYGNYGTYSGTTVTSGTPVSGVFIQPAQIKKVSSGTPVSGVYLNELPATGMDLGWMDYMIGFMAIVLVSVGFAVTKAKKTFSYSSQE